MRRKIVLCGDVWTISRKRTRPAWVVLDEGERSGDIRGGCLASQHKIWVRVASPQQERSTLAHELLHALFYYAKTDEIYGGVYIDAVEELMVGKLEKIFCMLLDTLAPEWHK